MAVHFEKPFKSNMDASLSTEKVSESQTKVTWGIQGVSSYPMNIMNLALPSMLGKDLDSNLSSLKVILEQQ